MFWLGMAGGAGIMGALFVAWWVSLARRVRW